MFSVRQEEGKWYISQVRGKTFHGTAYPDGVWKTFTFKSKGKALLCVKELNEQIYLDWKQANKLRVMMSTEMLDKTMSIIKRHANVELDTSTNT